MTAPDRAGLQGIATECATLVARQFGRHLDWSPASLDELVAKAREIDMDEVRKTLAQPAAS